MSTTDSFNETDLQQTQIGPDLIIITGMSGAGRTEAMHTFEDIGYFCIDNLPPTLLGNLVSLAGLASSSLRKIAVVCDLRSKEFFPELKKELYKFKEIGISYSVLFLDSNDEVLLNRYKTTRRRHPMCEKGMSIIQGIRKERLMLKDAKKLADYVLDTSSMLPHVTRKKIRAIYSAESLEDGIGVSVYSFGFKHGPALDADIVIDVRFLPNPFYVPELRSQSGKDKDVHDFVMHREETKKFLKRWFALLDILLPGYIEEGKQYLSIAIGCTGGQHRSVALAEETGKYLSQSGYNTTTTHRDLALAEVEN